MSKRGKVENGVMTPLDLELCMAVLKFSQEKNKIPTLAELGVELKITRQGVKIRMDSMERRGLLHKRPHGRSRYFNLTDIGLTLFGDHVPKDTLVPYEDAPKADNVIQISEFRTRKKRF